jgi:hypothetical protein
MSFEDGLIDIMSCNPLPAEESSIQTSDTLGSSSGIREFDKDMALLH